MLEGFYWEQVSHEYVKDRYHRKENHHWWASQIVKCGFCKTEKQRDCFVYYELRQNMQAPYGAPPFCHETCFNLQILQNPHFYWKV